MNRHDDRSLRVFCYLSLARISSALINHMQPSIDSILIIYRANIFLCQPRLNRHILFRNDEPTIVRMVIRMSEQCHQSTMFLMKSDHSVEINIKNGICIPPSRERRFCPKTASLIFSSITSLQPSFHSFYSCPRLIHNPSSSFP